MQEPALRAANALGLETIAADGNTNAPFAGLAARFFPIDLKDKESLLHLAMRLRDEPGGLSAVFTAGTDFSATVAYITEALGLPGNTYETALNTTDKARMRAVFDTHGVPSPRFIRVTNGEKLQPHFDFPVVVKPVDNMGARGCRKVCSSAELRPAVEDALAFSRSGAAIIEEYMDGPEYSIDSVVYQNKIYITGIADRHIFFPPYFIEMGHTLPARIAEPDITALLAVFKKGIHALGIQSGCAKGDMKLTARGPMIGEIASRLSGGYMSGWTYPYASGAELTKAAILAALGRPITEIEAALAVKCNNVSAERAFISIPGTVHAIYGIEEAQKSAYIKNIFFRISQKDNVEFPVNNVTKCGNVISSAAEWDTAASAAENAVRAVLISLQCPNQRTEEFLYNTKNDTYPPDAFTLTPALRAELDLLPHSCIPAKCDAALVTVHPFAGLQESGIADWHGRTADESVAAARVVTKLPLPVAKTGEQAHLGREFWQALVRGGYQGAAYYVEKYTGNH